VLAGGLWLDGPQAALLFATALAVFALGRYLALTGVGFQLGWAAGRAAGGFLLAAAPDALRALAAAAALAGGLAFLWLERFIPAPIRRTPRRLPVRPSPVPEPAAPPAT
jgi:hypothetical protein